VSWERLLCGSGLAWIDATLRGSRTADTPARVAQRAQAGDASATAAARWFSRALGAFAGDVCLALRASGGVYLAGGVLAGLGPAFERAMFRDGFTDKGRLRALLEDVPCWRIDAGDLALHGLADIARGRIVAPGVLAGTMHA
jgi:glucokinase